jgi:hypothetical protein
VVKYGILTSKEPLSCNRVNGSQAQGGLVAAGIFVMMTAVAVVITTTITVIDLFHSSKKSGDKNDE